MLNSDSKDSLEPALFPLALVTGAAHRLGKAFALQLASQGYAIGLHYHSSLEQANVTLKELRAFGTPVFVFHADLTDENQVRQMFAQVDRLLDDPGSHLSGLAVLVNSAASMPRADARTLSVNEFDSVMDLNLRAPFLCAQLAYARMQSGSLIVNISDIAAQKAWSGFPAYTVSKAGLDALTRVLARSFAPRVRVNAIAPGLALASEEMSAAEWERLIKRVPAQRGAFLQEICAALEFLIKNEYIIGQTIVVDGGYSLL